MIRLTEAQALLLRDYLGGYNDLAPVMQAISEQLANPGYANDFIDGIVDIIMNKNARNVIPIGTVTALQKAVLIPSEMSKLRAMVNSAINCPECSRHLEDGEAVTLVGGVPYCMLCVRANYVRCSGCGDPREISGKEANAMISPKKCGCMARTEATVEGGESLREMATAWAVATPQETEPPILTRTSPQPFPLTPPENRLDSGWITFSADQVRSLAWGSAARSLLNETAPTPSDPAPLGDSNA